MLKLITATTTTAVNLARVKDRLHIDTNDFDTDLTDLIVAAQAATETAANIVMQRSSWEYRSNAWHAMRGRMDWDLDRGFYLPFPHLRIPSSPVRDVTAITYLDPTGTSQTVDPANYSWERTPDGADVTFVPTFVVPEVSQAPNAVQVEFDAGYDDPSESGSGDDPELKLPPQAATAILYLVAHWHTNRTSVVVDSRSAPFEIPDTFDFLVKQIKVYR